VRHPGSFAGAFVHSAIACGAAGSPMSALKVMREGADTDSEAIGTRARAAAGGSVRLPIVIVQGDSDDVVAGVNAEDVEKQFLALNGGKRELVRVVRIPRLAHAWSGGDKAYPFNDPRTQDATALLGEAMAAAVGAR
jgi:hypothetical protein